MKKVFAFLMLAATLAACSREELPQVIEQPETPTTYTLSVKADRGVDTRALALDDKTLNAIWDGSERVYVFLNDNLVNYIAVLTPDQHAHSDPASCTLEGNFVTAPEEGAKLTLILNSSNYSGQDGTLANIAKWNDYAVATLTVTGIDGNQILTEEPTAQFQSQQAIVKFTLKDRSGNAISPKALTVTDGTSTVELTSIPDDTYTKNGAGVLYVAFPAAGTAKAFTLTATVGQDTYTYVKSSATLAVGKYYSIAVKMTLNTNIYDLGDLTIYDANGLFTAPNGAILIGTFADGGERNVRIADGATVTLRGVTLHNTDVDYAGVALIGSATIILEDDNVISGGSHHAGISLNGSGSTLTIEGTGSLDVTGGYGDAGIGSYEALSGDNFNCGAIIIDGGTITAKGGTGGAGIGCGGAEPGGNTSCVSITINGGTVTATGGFGAAGIGCGGALLSASGNNSGNITNSCGPITINGGSVTATGGSGAAGIGCGSGQIIGTGDYSGVITDSCGAITISAPARVSSTKAWNAPYSIGPSDDGRCESVTIYGEVYWNGSPTMYDAVLRTSPLVIPIS